MANLVDDFKNFIPYEVPDRVRIRAGVVTVPNSEDAIEPLDLFEGVICERTNISSSNVSSSLSFTSNVTMDSLIFKIPMDSTISNGSTPYTDNYLWNSYKDLANTNRIVLYPIVFYNGTNRFLVNMRWLVLRIA